MKIAHVSDLHFGTVLPQVESAAAIALQRLEPDLIIVSGDITQRARKDQFTAARDFLDRLQPIPMVSIPGNHDIPLFNIFGRFFAPYFGYQKYFKGTLDGCFSFSGVDVLVLNSTSKFRHVQGALDPKSLEKCLSQFAKDARVRVVAFHHPMDCLKAIDEKNLLRNRTAVLELFSHHKVDLVLGGHIHDPVTRLSSFRNPEIKPPFLFSVAGTTTSTRTRRGAPNSFNVYNINTDGVVSLEFTRHVLAASGAYETEENTVFTRGEPENSWSYKQ